jgi:dCMP deaminase
MRIAETVAIRSPDPKKQVGAVIVDSRKRIVSSGFNGLPSGFNETYVDWDNRDQVHSIIIHAECNAILYCNSKFEGVTLYCTLSPCPECVKLIKAAGISNVFFKEKYRRFDETAALAKVFNLELTELK